jgi:tetratricopeptide (TPR) repeat protein
MTTRKPYSRRRGKKAAGSQTNVAGDMQGPAFTGQFQGPVTASGEAVVMQGPGAIYKPQGPVEQHYYFNIPKADELPRLPTIPDPPPDFTGREEELKDLPAKVSSGTNIIGLHSNGGVGKTALALKLAEQLKGCYPDGQVMVDMRGTSVNPATPSEAMGSVIHAYNRNEKLPDSEGDIKELYLQLLRDKKALILLDNALDDKQVLKLIPPKTCCLLVTSRNTIILPGLHRKDLGVLKPQEALDLLLNIWRQTSGLSKTSEVNSAWSEIASLCGFLPLALRAAASHLANAPNISPSKYAEKLKDERTRLEQIGEEGVELSVDASFSLSFQLLDAKTQQIFLNASVFPSDFDGQAEEQICQDEDHIGLSELLRWSLVDYMPLDPDYGRYKLHDLTRLFASARQSAESNQIVQERHANYYKELLSAADNLYLKGSSSIQAGLALYDREVENIRAGQAWARKNLQTNSQAAQLSMSYPDAGAYVLNLRLHPRKRIAWLETALAAAQQLKNRKMQGAHLGNLGIGYADLGDARKAIKYYEQALVIAREIGDNRSEGAILGNLGSAYIALGEADKAIEYYEKALAIAIEIGDKRGEGARLGNLGIAYEALGKAGKAIEYYEQYLAIALEIGDRRDEGNSLGNLGSAYVALGDARKAIKYYEQALVIAREIEDKRSEGAILGNLGIGYAALGDAREAIKYHEQALVIARETGDKRGEGAILGNLGLAYAAMGETSKAIEYYEKALAIAIDLEDSQNKGIWLGNLGSAYFAMGDARKAIEYHDQALAIDREIGAKRGEGADLGNLGLAYGALGKTRKALEYYEQQLTIAREIGDRRGEANACWNLGLAYEKAGDLERAVDLMRICIEFEHNLGHPDVEKDANYLENLRAKLGTK